MTFYLSSFCCICLMETDGEQLHRLDNTDADNVQFIDKLKFCQFGTDWLDNDVPVFICSICCRNLSIAYEFKKVCVRNNERLKGYISHIKGTSEQNQINPRLEIQQLENNFQYEQNKVNVPDLYPVCQVKVTYDQPNLFNSQSKQIPNTTDLIKNAINNLTVTSDTYQPELVKIEPPDLTDNENYKCSKDQETTSNSFEGVPVKNEPVSDSSDNSDDENYQQEESSSDDEVIESRSKKKTLKKYQKLCTVCNKIFAGSTELKRHSMQHTGERPHSCDICQKSFIQLTSLKEHIITHTKERNYTCNLCNKNFTLKRSLKKHILTHTGQKKYQCGVCSKSFLEKFNFERHLAIHNDIKRHQCTYCGKQFSDKSNLDKHILTHTGEKPHFCTECNKRFIRKSELRKHSLIHSSERPHACSICSKHFSDKTELENHLLTHTAHTGDKPHMCTECNKSFVNKYTFNRHLSSHGSQQSGHNRCTQCAKSFSTLSALNTHIATHHTYW